MDIDKNPNKDIFKKSIKILAEILYIIFLIPTFVSVRNKNINQLTYLIN